MFKKFIFITLASFISQDSFALDYRCVIRELKTDTIFRSAPEVASEDSIDKTHADPEVETLHQADFKERFYEKKLQNNFVFTADMKELVSPERLEDKTQLLLRIGRPEHVFEYWNDFGPRLVEATASGKSLPLKATIRVQDSSVSKAFEVACTELKDDDKDDFDLIPFSPYSYPR